MVGAPCVWQGCSVPDRVECSAGGESVRNISVLRNWRVRCGCGHWACRCLPRWPLRWRLPLLLLFLMLLSLSLLLLLLLFLMDHCYARAFCVLSPTRSRVACIVKWYVALRSYCVLKTVFASTNWCWTSQCLYFVVLRAKCVNSHVFGIDGAVFAFIVRGVLFVVRSSLCVDVNSYQHVCVCHSLGCRLLCWGECLSASWVGCRLLCWSDCRLLSLFVVVVLWSWSAHLHVLFSTFPFILHRFASLAKCCVTERSSSCRLHG